MKVNRLIKSFLESEIKTGHVLVSDALMKRYFDMTWKEYKKRELDSMK